MTTRAESIWAALFAEYIGKCYDDDRVSPASLDVIDAMRWADRVVAVFHNVVAEQEEQPERCEPHGNEACYMCLYDLIADHREIERQAMQAIDLDELQRLCDAATPGPWEVSLLTVVAQGGTRRQFEVDAQFVDAAREALPTLIARARLLELKSRAQRTGKPPPDPPEPTKHPMPWEKR